MWADNVKFVKDIIDSKYQKIDSAVAEVGLEAKIWSFLAFYHLINWVTASHQLCGQIKIMRKGVNKCRNVIKNICNCVGWWQCKTCFHKICKKYIFSWMTASRVWQRILLVTSPRSTWITLWEPWNLFNHLRSRLWWTQSSA